MLTPRSRALAGAPEALVLRPTPHRSYAGHEADVLDVAWSRSQFLLSASMDKTVRLWHISMPDCLRVFRRARAMPHAMRGGCCFVRARCLHDNLFAS